MVGDTIHLTTTAIRIIHNRITLTIHIIEKTRRDDYLSSGVFLSDSMRCSITASSKSSPTVKSVGSTPDI